MIVCHLLGAPACGRIQASSVTEPLIRKSEVLKVLTAPAKLIAVEGATVGYAAALAAVPLNVAEPLVPPKGDAPPKTTPAEPTVTERAVPEASDGVEPAALLKRYHSTGPSEVTAEP